VKKFIYLFLLLIIFINCSDDKNPLNSSKISSFEIYFLKDTTITPYQADQENLNDLKLDSIPWISHNDIEFYDFSTHCIYLKSDKKDFFSYYDKGHFDPVLLSKPFVVCVNNIRCYLGSISSLALSMGPVGLHINEYDVWYYPKDVIHISEEWSSNEDIRSDSRIREALIQLNLYHAGLSVELQSVTIIENSDISNVQYTFNITNNDFDNLFVIDPDLMVSELFHYYTNGVTFNTPTNHIWSEYKHVQSPDPFDSWDTTWFIKLKHRESIQRSVRLKGYPPIPSGTYNCSFKFSGPDNIEKEQRVLRDSRYWIGEITSSTLLVFAKK
jgi:hypothetical protein